MIWWLGSAQSALGSALAGIALSFLVLYQTGSAGAMGVNLALALLPALLSPLFGTLADRLPVKLPLMLGNLLRAALQLGIGIAALHGQVPLEALHAAALLTGLIGAFYGPVSMGITPRLIPPSQLARASGLMQGSAQSMQLIGLVGGGLLISNVGSAPALIFDSLSFLIFGALLTLVHFPARQTRAVGERFWPSFMAGLRYMRSCPLLLGLPLIALLVNASLAPMEMLLPKRMLALGAGAAGYGLFLGIELGGLLIGSLGLAWLGERARPRTLSVLGLGGLGLGMLALSLTQTTVEMDVLAAWTGFFSGLTNVSIAVLFQQRVPPEYYGRVGSLLNMVGTAGVPLTLLALAPFADQLPIALIFSVAGVITLLGALAWVGVLRREPPPTSPPPVPA